MEERLASSPERGTLVHWLRIMLTCIVHTTKWPQLKRVLGAGKVKSLWKNITPPFTHGYGGRRLEAPDNVKTLQ